MYKDLKEKFAFTLGATHVGISHNIGGTLHRFVESFTHVGIFHNTRRVGFTLAEVLITLGIIGIVSALTIPTLIKNYQIKVRDNQFKRVYTNLNQALRMTLVDFDYVPKCYYSVSGGRLSSDCKVFMPKFLEKFKAVKSCSKNSFAQGCIPHYDGVDVVHKEKHKNDADYDEQYWDEYVKTNLYYLHSQYIETKNGALVLSDGSIIMQYGNLKGDFPIFVVDVNGFSDKNKWGHDLFMFHLQYDGNKFYFYADASIYVPADGGISTQGLIRKLFGSYNT